MPSFLPQAVPKASHWHLGCWAQPYPAGAGTRQPQADSWQGLAQANLLLLLLGDPEAESCQAPRQNCATVPLWGSQYAVAGMYPSTCISMLF